MRDVSIAERGGVVIIDAERRRRLERKAKNLVRVAISIMDLNTPALCINQRANFIRKVVLSLCGGQYS